MIARTKKLTEADRERIARNLDLAPRLASCYPSRVVDHDERTAVGYAALCEAALCWRRRGPFRSHALFVVRNRILNAIRAATYRRSDQLPAAISRHDGDLRMVDIRDEVATLLLRLDRLSPREREVIELCISGVAWHEIAVNLGKHKSTISALKSSAAAKLSAAIP